MQTKSKHLGATFPFYQLILYFLPPKFYLKQAGDNNDWKRYIDVINFLARNFALLIFATETFLHGGMQLQSKLLTVTDLPSFFVHVKKKLKSRIRCDFFAYIYYILC